MSSLPHPGAYRRERLEYRGYHVTVYTTRNEQDNWLAVIEVERDGQPVQLNEPENVEFFRFADARPGRAGFQIEFFRGHRDRLPAGCTTQRRHDVFREPLATGDHISTRGRERGAGHGRGLAVGRVLHDTVTAMGTNLGLSMDDTRKRHDILAQGIVGSTDWTSIGSRIEVYHGWRAGNTTTPNPVITISTANPKSISASGNYLFVGYVHTEPDIDAFNLNTGSLDATLNNSSPNTVYVGNDVDSMYGLRSYRRSTGEYVITKDNYNGSSVVVYRWTP